MAILSLLDIILKRSDGSVYRALQRRTSQGYALAGLGIGLDPFGDPLSVGVALGVLMIAGLFWPSSSEEPAAASDETASDEADTPPPRRVPPQALDHISAGLLVLDHNYRIVHFNQVVHDFFPDATIAQDEPLPHDLAERLPASGGHTLFSWPPGSDTVLQLEAHAVRDDADTGWVLSLRDVTDIARTEKALHDTDRLLEAILQTSVTAVAVVDDQGHITYANRRAENILGLRQQDKSSWRYNQLGWMLTPVEGHPETLSQTPLRDVLETGTPIRGMQCAITWPDGTQKYLSLHAAPLPTSSGTRRVVFSVEDITSRYEMQQQLRKEQRFFEVAVNSLPGIFYMVDESRTHRRWNRRLETATGYTPEELAARDFPDVFDPGDRSHIRTRITDLFDRDTGFMFEASLVAKDGTETPYLFTGTSLELDGTHYLITVGLDATEQKQRERELRKAKLEADAARAEAERMNELKSAFLTNMSHEIRTPLTSIIGFADVMVDEDDPPPSFAEHIATGGRRLLHTLDAILELSKLESGERALSPSTVNVTDCLQTTLDRFSDDIEQKDLQLSIATPDRPFHATVDGLALHRIMEHLLGNAVKFTTEGDRVMIHLQHEDNDLRLVVSDAGIGIARDFLPHAFEPFTQASTGKAREHEGSGLGLAITKGLVELLDGTITIDSVEGRGTTVSVRLPAGVDAAGTTSG